MPRVPTPSPVRFLEAGPGWQAYSSLGPRPSAIAWDGENLWTYDLQSKAFYQHDPETLQVLAYYEDPIESGEAYGMTYDGRYLWRMRYAHLEAFDPENMSQPVFSYTGDEPWGEEMKVEGDFDHMRGVYWQQGTLYSIYQSGYILRHNPRDYSKVSGYGAVTTSVAGAEWDGEFLWYADRATGWLYKLKPEKGEITDYRNILQGICALPATPSEIAIGKGFFWFVDGAAQRIYKVDQPSASALDELDPGLGGGQKIEISGGILEHTEWNGEVPYLLEGDIQVLPGVTLEIGRGARLFFTQDAGLIVEGVLEIKGESDEPVLLTHADPFELWRGIEFRRGSQGEIKFAEIQYARDGILARDARPEVSDSLIRRIEEYGLGYIFSQDFCDIEIRGNHIENVGEDDILITQDPEAVEKPTGGKIMVKGNTLYDSGDGVLIENVWAEAEISNNIVAYQHYQPIQFTGRESQIRENYLYGSTAGISSQSPGSTVSQNLIHTTGRAEPGSTIVIEGIGVDAGVDGRFFLSLPEGAHRIQVSTEGDLRRVDFEILGGRITQLDLMP